MAKNVAASVRAKLKHLAVERKEQFQFVLTRYGIERLLYRLSKSTHADQFILKGAMLYALWRKEPHRATKDVDFLGHGAPEPERFREMFSEIITIEVEDDGLLFDPSSVEAERIREDQRYEGVRVTFVAILGGARINLQVDVGFGDAVTPGVERHEFPTLLEQPAPVLSVYPRETWVAEKFQAMVELGIANSRMKDFFDIRTVAAEFSFEGGSLSDALRATFDRRETELPSQLPLAFTVTFHDDEAKKKQWTAYVRKNRLDPTDLALVTVVGEIEAFLMPLMRAMNEGKPAKLTWPPGGPWGD